MIAPFNVIEVFNLTKITIIIIIAIRKNNMDNPNIPMSIH